MKILFDIYHLPQLNFYKNAILSLSKEDVIICCVDRGKLVDVIKHELPNFELHVIGSYKYNNGFFSMLLRIIIPRIFKLSKLIASNKIGLVISSLYQANIIAYFNKIPNLILYDDKRKYIFNLQSIIADKLFMPKFYLQYKNVEHFNALKEWSYLAPKSFTQDPDTLQHYNLEEKSYIFIREVSTESQNYAKQDEDLILKISKSIKNIPVILSLENKKNSSYYPDDWIILEEPVQDIHSLMFFSKIVISSGDSMAREGAMLGVPSIYCGFRNMPANKVLIDKNMLWQVNVNDVPNFIDKILNNKILFENQERFRKNLYDEWIDVTKFILESIKKYKKE